MNATELLWLAAASAVGTCLAAIGARALREFSRHELQEICEKRQQCDRFGEVLREHDRVALAIEIMVAIGAATFAASLTAWYWSQTPNVSAPSLHVVVTGAIAAGIAMAFVKTTLPWSLSRLFAAPFLYHTWWAWRVVALAVSPLLFVARLLDALLHRVVGRTPAVVDEGSFEEEIRTIVTEGHREGLLEEDAREMIEGVMELGDADVAHIMTPRTDVHMLPVGCSWEEVIADVIECGHTRIPVYNETRDDIVGVLYVKDLLQEIAKPIGKPKLPLAEILRKPIFVPETKAVDELLQMFQQSRTHMALALDEYGGVAGLVTIEDALEEIVGEIVDEYDDEVEQEIRPDGDNLIALGRAHVDEINEALGATSPGEGLPEDGDYDTIGGFLLTELGRVPTAGDTIDWSDSLRVKVLEATKRRVERVRIERIAGDTSRESA